MCLIVYKEGNKAVFTNRQFKYMISRNPDGLGIMYRGLDDKGRKRVLVEKCMGSPKQKFRMFQKYRGLDMYAMHSRIKTHGNVDEANCHPYKILDIDDGDPIDMYMMHNGTISAAPEIDKTKSDTWHYIEYVLRPLIKSNIDLFWDNEYINDMVQEHIGHSKLLFMRSDDVKYPVLILNHKLGTDKDGCWLSNSHSTEPYKVYHYGNSAGNKNHGYNTASQFARSLPGNELTDLDYASQDDTYDWCGYRDVRETDKKEINQSVSKEGKEYLPDATKDDKIVDLASIRNSQEKEDIENLIYLLSSLRGLSDNAIREFIRDDPDTAADIILNLNPTTTLDYETIIKLIKDKDEIDGIVRMLRNMAYVKSYNATN